MISINPKRIGAAITSEVAAVIRRVCDSLIEGLRSYLISSTKDQFLRYGA